MLRKTARPVHHIPNLSAMSAQHLLLFSSRCHSFADDEHHPSVGYCWAETTPPPPGAIGLLDEDEGRCAAMSLEGTSLPPQGFVVHTIRHEGSPIRAVWAIRSTGRREGQYFAA